MHLQGSMWTLIVAAVLDSADGLSDTCGWWRNANCNERFTGNYTTVVGNEQFELYGTVAGTFSSNLTTYNTQCGLEQISAQFHGSFADLGSFGGDTNSRKLMFNYTQGRIMPFTTDASDALNAACPCGWAVNESISVLDCFTQDKVDQCDLGWIVGATVCDGCTFTFNQPTYAVMTVEGGGTSLNVSLMNKDPSIFYQAQAPAPWSNFNTNEQPCTVTESFDLCGSFVTQNGCEVVLSNNGTQAISKLSTFIYRGPTHTALMEGSWGIYGVTTQFFSDAVCKSLKLEVVEGGSLGFAMNATSGIGFITQKQQNSLTLTPTTVDSALELASECPCLSAQAWKAGNMRTLTTCSSGCSKPYFNDRLPPGQTSYAYVSQIEIELGNKLKQINFGLWTMDALSAEAQGFTSALEKEKVGDFDDDDDVSVVTPCEDEAYSFNYCGVFNAACSAGGTEVDTVKYLTLSGTLNSINMEGRIEAINRIYTPAQSCDLTSTLFEITSIGFFSYTNDASTIGVGGLRSVDIDFVSFTIIASTPATATELNNIDGSGCPCDGFWRPGVERVLVVCPQNTCSAKYMHMFFPSGMGAPVYGVIQYNGRDNTMRLSELSANKEQGYQMRFDKDRDLLQQVAVCPYVDHTIGFEGCWHAQCFRLGTSGLAESATFLATDKHLVYVNKSIYTQQSGCIPQLDQHHYDFVAEGAYSTLGASTTVTNGKVIQFNRTYLKITPRSAEAVRNLTNDDACKTCAPWKINVSSWFNNTNICSCPQLEKLFGYPIATLQAYAVAQTWLYDGDVADENNLRHDNIADVFRLTQFSTTELEAKTYNLTKHDGAYVKSIHECPKLKPHREPYVDNCVYPCSAGDYSLLVLMSAVPLYLIGGILFNLKQQGIGQIPHRSMWVGFFGLVADGFDFVFCTALGLRGGSGESRSRYQTVTYGGL
eukprot:m.63144 g.63144  ORF g.63144 m.63144 type:complete len:934 (-) comp23246_c0_seq1:58-2859(-)